MELKLRFQLLKFDFPGLGYCQPISSKQGTGKGGPLHSIRILHLFQYGIILKYLVWFRLKSSSATVSLSSRISSQGHEVFQYYFVGR